MNALPVVYNHDAAIDEYIAALMLQNMQGVNLQAIVLTNGDCLAEPAMDTAWRISRFTGQPPVPLSLSAARVFNAFPYSYRVDCIRQGQITALQPFGPPPLPPYALGEEAIRTALRDAISQQKPLTIVCTCSLTTICDVLKASPELEEGLEHLLWMGGAIYRPGNLDPTTIPPEIANPAAEWNVFSDPASADWVLNHPDRKYRVTVCPLDVTDQAKITPEFKQKLAEQAATSRLSMFASQSYELVKDEPFYELWNVCVVVYMAHPEFFSDAQPMVLNIVKDGFYQGNMKPAGSDAGGQPVDVVFNITRPDAFYDYVLEVLRTY